MNPHLRWTSLASLLCVATAAVVMAADPVASDRTMLRGTWRVVSLEVDGSKSPEQEARKLYVVNGDDGSWILYAEGREICRGENTLTPNREPKTLDFKTLHGAGVGSEHHGIYELGETRRKICFTTTDKERPAAFVSPPGSGTILIEFERE